ncbi:MAG: translation initiation factor 2 [Sphaerochaeta sp.]
MVELPYLLRSENIARIEGNELLIGDRRIYPFERRFVHCSTVEEIALALKQMVSQGGGPLEVALTTMTFVSEQMQKGRTRAAFAELERSCELLKASRPTNTTMKRTLNALLAKLETCEDFVVQIPSLVEQVKADFAALYHQMGRHGSSLVPEAGGVLTTCFAEHTFLLSLAYAKEAGKQVVVYVPETRPYLQGSRLTAPSLMEMGIETRVITDGMGATFLREGVIGAYMTASDLVCMDGTVVNKVGTLANAIAANYYGVPYYVFSVSPDSSKQDAMGIEMEWRFPGEVTQCMGHPTTGEGVDALYPAFDIIPADLVRGIVTGKGILKPEEIRRNFQ